MWEHSISTLEAAVAIADAKPRASHRSLLSAAFLVFAAYYVGARVGFALTFEPQPISVFWPPNALLLAALLLAPMRWWPALLAAAFPAHLLAQMQSSVPIAMILCWFLSNISEALIGAWCLRLLSDGKPAIDNFRNLGRFVFAAVLLAPFASSFLDAAFVQWIGYGAGDYWQSWKLRFFANALSVLIIVPLVLSWSHGASPLLRGVSGRRFIETLLLFCGLLAAGLFVFNFPLPDSFLTPALLYLPLPFLLWAVLRFGSVGGSSAFAIFAVLAIWGASHGRGPFIEDTAVRNALSVQFFLIFTGLMLLTMAAAMQERRRSEGRLREAQDRLTHVSRLAVMSELTASIAHEINQPLGAILSNADAAEMLLDRDPSRIGELRQILDDIRRDDLRASEVIRHLRSLMRRRELELSDCDINRVVEDVLRLAGADLARRRIAVDRQLESLPIIQGDTVHLQQVLLNLILNAADAMADLPFAARTLELRTSRTESGISVSVSDRGPGIAPEDAERLFESFYTTKKEGMGLGLSISRAIIEAHGGGIRVENRPDGGARFVFSIPLRTQKEQA